MALLKLIVLLILTTTCSHALPTGADLDPAAVAADPALAAVPVAAAPPPAVVAAPVPVAAAPIAAAPVAAAPAPAVQGGGIVTEHKNPDGSTITVTRYNGPLPADAFRSPLTGGLFSPSSHDAYLLSGAAQLYQLQAQQQAMIRNMQIFNGYNSYYPNSYAPVYSPFYSYYAPQRTYSGNYFGGHSPFLPFGFGGGYPFYPYGGGAPVRSA